MYQQEVTHVYFVTALTLTGCFPITKIRSATKYTIVNSENMSCAYIKICLYMCILTYFTNNTHHRTCSGQLQILHFHSQGCIPYKEREYKEINQYFIMQTIQIATIHTLQTTLLTVYPLQDL